MLGPRLCSLALVTLGLATTSLAAHSGGTDRCGGHNDRKRGGYHVHNRAKYCACYPEKCATETDRPKSESTRESGATTRAYSCDNPQVEGGGCFPAGHDHHMTVALYPKPMKGTPIRLRDDGSGIAVEIVETRVVLDQKWLLVRTKEGTRSGWIAGGYVK